jgi:hypothetical protein
MDARLGCARDSDGVGQIFNASFFQVLHARLLDHLIGLAIFTSPAVADVESGADLQPRSALARARHAGMTCWHAR